MSSSDTGIQMFGMGAPKRNPTPKIRETIHGKSLIVDIDEGHETLSPMEVLRLYMHRR
jgi:hypothetical protein